MNITTLMKAKTALPIVAMLALYGCGGGGAGPQPVAGNQMGEQTEGNYIHALTFNG